MVKDMIPFVVLGIGVAVAIIGGVILGVNRSHGHNARALIGFRVLAAGWVIAALGAWFFPHDSASSWLGPIALSLSALLCIYYYKESRRSGRS